MSWDTFALSSTIIAYLMMFSLLFWLRIKYVKSRDRGFYLEKRVEETEKKNSKLGTENSELRADHEMMSYMLMGGSVIRIIDNPQERSHLFEINYHDPEIGTDIRQDVYSYYLPIGSAANVTILLTSNGKILDQHDFVIEPGNALILGTNLDHLLRFSMETGEQSANSKMCWLLTDGSGNIGYSQNGNKIEDQYYIPTDLVY